VRPVFRHYDTAGYLENTGYDFKGNLLGHARQLGSKYKQSPDWPPLAALTGGAAPDTAAGAAGSFRLAMVGATTSAVPRSATRPTVYQAASPANATMWPNVMASGHMIRAGR
jgi:hypothetical protein